MTAKKKAKELFGKYYPLASSYVGDRYDVAKLCALIAVEEMILFITNKAKIHRGEYRFWNEVKKEINELRA